MVVTKFEHACLVVEDRGKRLIIDPGGFTASLTDFGNVAGIVVTHEHQDHFDPVLVEKIAATNPTVPIMTVQSVAEQLPGKQVQIVGAGKHVTAGPFELQFYGGEHALIHTSIPRVANIGVLVNELLYYPGDSFAAPDKTVKTLALPVNAPWMKMAEAMDFLYQIKPQVAFPTHDSFLSEPGQALADRLVGAVAQSIDTTYHTLKPSESLELR